MQALFGSAASLFSGNHPPASLIWSSGETQAHIASVFSQAQMAALKLRRSKSARVLSAVQRPNRRVGTTLAYARFFYFFFFFLPLSPSASSRLSLAFTAFLVSSPLPSWPFLSRLHGRCGFRRLLHFLGLRSMRAPQKDRSDHTSSPCFCRVTKHSRPSPFLGSAASASSSS